MRKQQYDLPTMYADHHVLEVRRLLLELPGVVDVYASSAFQFVEVSYDESVINDIEISMKLDEAGYLGEWTAPIEIGATGTGTGGNGAQKAYFRHSEAYETTHHAGKSVMSFAQQVGDSAQTISRPLWPCPGLGVLSSRKRMEEEE